MARGTNAADAGGGGGGGGGRGAPKGSDGRVAGRRDPSLSTRAATFILPEPSTQHAADRRWRNERAASAYGAPLTLRPPSATGIKRWFEAPLDKPASRSNGSHHGRLGSGNGGGGSHGARPVSGRKTEVVRREWVNVSRDREVRARAFHPPFHAPAKAKPRDEKPSWNDDVRVSALWKDDARASSPTSPRSPSRSGTSGVTAIGDASVGCRPASASGGLASPRDAARRSLLGHRPHSAAPPAAESAAPSPPRRFGRSTLGLSPASSADRAPQPPRQAAWRDPTMGDQSPGRSGSPLGAAAARETRAGEAPAMNDAVDVRKARRAESARRAEARAKAREAAAEEREARREYWNGRGQSKGPSMGASSSAQGWERLPPHGGNFLGQAEGRDDTRETRVGDVGPEIRPISRRPGAFASEPKPVVLGAAAADHRAALAYGGPMRPKSAKTTTAASSSNQSPPKVFGRSTLSPSSPSSASPVPKMKFGRSTLSPASPSSPARRFGRSTLSKAPPVSMEPPDGDSPGQDESLGPLPSPASPSTPVGGRLTSEDLTAAGREAVETFLQEGDDGSDEEDVLAEVDAMNADDATYAEDFEVEQQGSEGAEEEERLDNGHTLPLPDMDGKEKEGHQAGLETHADQALGEILSGLEEEEAKAQLLEEAAATGKTEAREEARIRSEGDETEAHQLEEAVEAAAAAELEEQDATPGSTTAAAKALDAAEKARAAAAEAIAAAASEAAALAAAAASEAAASEEAVAEQKMKREEAAAAVERHAQSAEVAEAAAERARVAEEKARERAAVDAKIAEAVARGKAILAVKRMEQAAEAARLEKERRAAVAQAKRIADAKAEVNRKIAEDVRRAQQDREDRIAALANAARLERLATTPPRSPRTPEVTKQKVAERMAVAVKLMNTPKSAKAMREMVLTPDEEEILFDLEPAIAIPRRK